MAARADTRLTSEITVDDWKQEVLRIATLKPMAKRWQEIKARLSIQNRNSYDICYNILRPLANSWKHDPFEKPRGELFQNLGLDPSRNYARHPESDALREALCRKVGISVDSGYFQITEAFVRSCRKFLEDIEANAPLRPVEQRPISLNPDTFEL